MSPLETALSTFQAAASTLDLDAAAKQKTAATLSAAKSADDAAAAQVTTDTASLQTAFDAVVSAAVQTGLKVNTPAAAA